MWVIETTDEFDEWFENLGEEEQDEIDTLMEVLKALGPFLKRPHADALNGSKHSNMKELRGKTAGAVLRVAYAFDPLKVGIALCGGDKKGVSERRFYKQLVTHADKLYDRHLEKVKQRKAELEKRKSKGDKNG